MNDVLTWLGGVDLGGNLQWEICAGGNFDRPVRPLLRTDAAEKSEVATTSVSGTMESNERVPLAGVIGMHAVVITMRRSPARDQLARWVRRTTDIVLRDLYADKRLHNRRIAVVPGNASRILDTRR